MALRKLSPAAVHQAAQAVVALHYGHRSWVTTIGGGDEHGTPYAVGQGLPPEECLDIRLAGHEAEAYCHLDRQGTVEVPHRVERRLGRSLRLLLGEGEREGDRGPELRRLRQDRGREVACCVWYALCLAAGNGTTEPDLPDGALDSVIRLDAVAYVEMSERRVDRILADRWRGLMRLAGELMGPPGRDIRDRGLADLAGTEWPPPGDADAPPPRRKDEGRKAREKPLRGAELPDELLAERTGPGIRPGLSFGGAGTVDVRGVVERVLFGQNAGHVLLRVTRPPCGECGHVEIEVLEVGPPSEAAHQGNADQAEGKA